MFPAIHLSFLEVAFGAQFLGAAVLLTSVILVDKLYTRPPQRERLNARFRHSLLRKMLMLRGQDTEVYLQTVSTASLDRSLEKCSGCSQKQRCETALRDGDVSSFAFCPNERVIEQLPQVQSVQYSSIPAHP